MTRSKGRGIDEPNMSDSALLVRVDDLINIAMGSPDKNIVNFKMVQTILHILARQMRMLEQQVEIRIAEIAPSLSGSEVSSDVVRGGKVGRADAHRSGTGKSPRRRGDQGVKEKDLHKEKGRSRDREKTDKPTRDKDGEDRYRDRSEGASHRDGKDPGKGDKRKGIDKRDKDDKDRDYDERDTEIRGGKDRSRDKGDRSEKDRDIDYGESDKGVRAEKDKGRIRGERDREEKGRGERDREEKGRGGKDRGEKDRGERDREEKGRGGKDRGERDREERDREEKGRGGKDRGEKDRGERDREEKGRGGKDRGERDREERDREERDREEKGHGGRDRDERYIGEREKGGRAEKDRDRDRGERDKVKSRTASGTSITISEIERDKEKILVVEKGPSTRKPAGRPRLGSIELVTQSQFRLLENAVEALKERARPLPAPTLPDNKKLRSDLAKGSASLTDTMQAMQLAARTQAAEKAIELMADMLTQLAASGALPQDIAGKAADIRQDFQDIKHEAKGTLPSAASLQMQQKPEAKKRGGPAGRESILTGPLISSYTGADRPSDPVAMDTDLRASTPPSSARPSKGARGSQPCVTHDEMDDALRGLRAELSTNMANMTARAKHAAEYAANTAKGVAEKLNIALNMDNRISTLFALVGDYSEQLNGFDSGLTTQMQGFQEQMEIMRSHLAGGLGVLAQVNNNAETAAVLELTERYEGLVQELDNTLHAHQALTSFQKQLGDELRSLVECVEMMREQKADRDEVLDGLRDKADSSRLAGLLTEVEFEAARNELQMRLDMCHDKFRRQDAVWMEAVSDFANITEGKAELMQLLSVRDDTQRQLRELHEKVQCLARQLGEPKAAVLARELARSAVCAACRVPALMSPRHALHDRPPRLPPLRRAAAPKDELQFCRRDVTGYRDLRDDKAHMCRRWCGGSHTLVTVAARARPPPPSPPAPPTRCYAGLGTDGQFYKFEEDLLPCVECNELTPEKVPGESQEKIPGEADFLPLASEDGAGDQGVRKVNLIKDTDARRVTVINEENLRRASDEVYNMRPRQSTHSEAARSRVAMMLDEDRPAEIGHIVKGRVTVVDEEAVRRATIIHDIEERRATIGELSEMVEEEQNATDDGKSAIQR